MAASLLGKHMSSQQQIETSEEEEEEEEEEKPTPSVIPDKGLKFWKVFGCASVGAFLNLLRLGRVSKA